MFSSVLTMYGRGLGSNPARGLSSDLIDLCGAAGVSESDSMACMTKGQVRGGEAASGTARTVLQGLVHADIWGVGSQH